MKKFLIGSLASMLLLTLSINCKKNITPPTNQNTVSQIKSAGEIHNQILNEVAMSRSFPDLSQDVSFAIIGNFLNKNYGVSDNIDYSGTFTSREERSDKRDISKAFGKYNASIMSKFYSSASPKDFDEKTIGIERQIQNDNALTKVERLQFINTLSVLKNSFKYWVEAAENPGHPWHSQHLRMMKQIQKSNTRTTYMAAGFCVGHALTYPTEHQAMAFNYCVAAADMAGYDDAFWYIYNGNNYEYANNQAIAQGSYLSGRAMGLGMIID